MSANAVAITIVGGVVVSIHRLAVLLNPGMFYFKRLQGFPESALKRNIGDKVVFVWRRGVRKTICTQVTKADQNHLDVVVHPPTNEPIFIFA